MHSSVVRLATAAAALTVITATGGCGLGGNKAACDALKKDLTDFSSNMKDATVLGSGASGGNAAAVTAKINDLATKVRQDGKKGDDKVASAADKLATVMEGMTKPGGATSALSGVEGATKDLQSACG